MRTVPANPAGGGGGRKREVFSGWAPGRCEFGCRHPVDKVPPRGGP